MPITNDDELREVVHRVGDDLQAIQDYLGREANPAGKVRFPRGYIRPVDSHRQRLLFISDPTLRHNLAYALTLSDVYRWILNRTSLFSIGREMVIKAGMFLAGSICESVTKNYLKGKVSKRRGYKDRTKHLADRGIISGDLQDELNWVWDRRNEMHLFLVTHRELGRYTLPQYERAATAVRSLLRTLQATPHP